MTVPPSELTATPTLRSPVGSAAVLCGAGDGGIGAEDYVKGAAAGTADQIGAVVSGKQVPAAVIGEFTAGERQLIYPDGRVERLDSVARDELYRILESNER